LSAKVHAAEHELLPRVVARLSMEAVNAEEAANPSGHE
jgi:folate-dependent phosphoribosylglycinamide formyltransferase PurN